MDNGPREFVYCQLVTWRVQTREQGRSQNGSREAMSEQLPVDVQIDLEPIPTIAYRTHLTVYEEALIDGPLRGTLLERRGISYSVGRRAS